MRRRLATAAVSLSAAALVLGVSTGTASGAAPGEVPVGGTEVFAGNYDTGDFGQWGTCQWQDYNSDCAGWDQSTHSATIADGGEGHTTAARFEVRDGDVPPFGGGERSEVSSHDAAEVVEGDERWYEFSMKFDESFENPTGGWFIPMQWHAGDGSPPLCLQVNNEGMLQFSNNRTSEATDITPVEPGKWVDFVLHVKFSSGDGALAESWVNGTKQPGVQTAPNMASDSNYLKMGIYRDDADSSTAVVWQDGLRVTAP